MLTIQEVKDRIEAAILKRDFMHEHTPSNFAILSKTFNTFEAVLTGNGDEKCLIPEVGTVHYLFRGQPGEVVPCLPTIYRGHPDDVEFFENRLRLVAFSHLLNSHPVVEHFFRRHHFIVNQEGLAQHYGLKTEILDLTSNLDIALFFAVCKYDAASDAYDYYHDNNPHTGILYVFDPLLDNEPSPSQYFDRYMNGNIKPIGLQAFPRPGRQYGYGVRLKKGSSTKSWMYKFSFTCEDSKYYYDKYSKGETLWTKDFLVGKSKMILNREDFSYQLFNEAFSKYRPTGWSANKMKRALRGIKLHSKCSDILFSDQEQKDIIDEWNSHLGREMCSHIVRKPWFEFVEKEATPDGEKLIGIHNSLDFRTFNQLATISMLNTIGSPEPPHDAEWKNYTGTPRPEERVNPDNNKWIKKDASMFNIFGKAFLTEKDWIIS